MKNIILDNQEISYLLKVSERSRSMRLAIYYDGRVVVSVPRISNFNFLVERFLQKKSKWILEKVKHFKDLSGRPLIKCSKADYKKYKEQAFVIANKKVQEFNKVYNFKFNKISIKNQRSRWGSCSKRGNLNFNYRIALLPTELADYIVVHEICHLGELNHSQKFWNLVAKTVPNHRELRSRLNKIGVIYQ